MTSVETFDSNSSVSSYEIEVTEEMMQLSAEALSRSGVLKHNPEETVRKMAAMKVESVLFFFFSVSSALSIGV